MGIGNQSLLIEVVDEFYQWTVRKCVSKFLGLSSNDYVDHNYNIEDADDVIGAFPFFARHSLGINQRNSPAGIDDFPPAWLETVALATYAEMMNSIIEFFSVTPEEWGSPTCGTWPDSPTDVYWWPTEFYQQKPEDYADPLSITLWPEDSVPKLPNMFGAIKRFAAYTPDTSDDVATEIMKIPWG
ncbi:Protein of unknown function [Gryllus bimaculatus]|nr:Protein of unknown function [Gryllus bimaculatus]